MTIFGVVWLIIILIGFILKDIKYMIIITLLGMIFQCNNVIALNSVSCGPQLITSFAFILKSLIYTKKNKEKEKIRTGKFYILTFVLVVYIIINTLTKYQDPQTYYLGLLQLIVYVITFYRMMVMSRNIDNAFFDKCIKIIASIILSVGFIQVGINIFGLPKNTIVQTLLYNDVTNPSIYYYKYSTRFYSTFMEPSFVAPLLVGMFLYFIDKKNKKRIDYSLIIGLLIAIVLTMSSTAYATLAITGMIYACKKIKKKSTWMYLIIALASIVFIGTTTDILNKVIFEKGSSGSAIVREMWNKKAYNSFIQYPITGLGYKSLRASSIIYDIIGELGLIGLFMYLSLILIMIKPYFSNKYSTMTTVASGMVFAAAIAQIIACPDLDLCSFWLVMYLYGLTIFIKKEQIKKGDNNEKNRNINFS